MHKTLVPGYIAHERDCRKFVYFNRPYSKTFKEYAIGMVKDGLSMRTTAKALNICPATLRGWLGLRKPKSVAAAHGPRITGTLHLPREAEIASLKRSASDWERRYWALRNSINAALALPEVA